MLKLYQTKLLKHGEAAFLEVRNKMSCLTTLEKLTEVVDLCILIFAIVNFDLILLVDLGIWFIKKRQIIDLGIWQHF